MGDTEVIEQADGGARARPSARTRWLTGGFAVATLALLAWVLVEVGLALAATAGPDAFAARLDGIPAGAHWLLVAGLAVHGAAGSLLVFGRSLNAERSLWVAVADRGALLVGWFAAAAHDRLFWQGAARAVEPYDAWVRVLSATPGGVPAVAFAYAVGWGAVAYLVTRAVMVAGARPPAGLRIALGVVVGLSVGAVGLNAAVGLGTGAGWEAPHPTVAEPCGSVDAP